MTIDILIFVAYPLLTIFMAGSWYYYGKSVGYVEGYKHGYEDAVKNMEEESALNIKKDGSIVVTGVTIEKEEPKKESKKRGPRTGGVLMGRPRKS